MHFLGWVLLLSTIWVSASAFSRVSRQEGLFNTLRVKPRSSSNFSDPRISRLAFKARSSGDSANGSDILVNRTQILARACGTGPASNYLINEHIALREDGLTKRASPRTTQYLIDVYFHIVNTQDRASVVTPAMVANQFGVLQEAYASSNISFRLVAAGSTVNNSWATGRADLDMKNALRKGNYSTLNVYFQTNLSTTAYGAATQLLGYCTLPTNVTYIPCTGCAPAEYPSVDYVLDGCNVLAGSMPGGTVLGYNSGKTAVHEIGHWFGLLHTFQGTTCAAGDPGDYIDDTPQESVSTDGCPAGKDSCPDNPGLDPIHNFMDYSTDACYESFTAQQIQRMHDMYGSLRFGY